VLGRVPAFPHLLDRGVDGGFDGDGGLVGHRGKYLTPDRIFNGFDCCRGRLREILPIKNTSPQTCRGKY
jgi:hypothetical protein